MNMKAAETGVSQFFPSHSSRGFAARFRGSAAQAQTKPPATQASQKEVISGRFPITKSEVARCRFRDVDLRQS